jgi:hypothetical protein
VVLFTGMVRRVPSGAAMCTGRVWVFCVSDVNAFSKSLVPSVRCVSVRTRLVDCANLSGPLWGTLAPSIVGDLAR